MPAATRVLDELRRAFEVRFGRAPELGARAPGRVNLIGEHTDYNEGLVLPLAIDRHTWVLAARRRDGVYRVWSRERGDGAEFDGRAPRRAGGWLDYVKGVVYAVRARGADPGGLDLAIASELPLESGLSSSAALGLGVATALDAAFGLGLGPRGRAEVAHRGESRFVGVGCGIMDPFASGLGRRDHALRIDCRSLEVDLVPLPAARARLLVADSGVRRRLAAGGYGDRVAECRAAFDVARDEGLLAGDARALRDVPRAALPDLAEVLEPTLLRRVRHVVTENARVEDVCAALGRGDLPAVGAVLRAGMQSLREDFDVSTPELDALCEIGDALPGVYGSRLTGAGLGGCTLHLVEPDAAEAVAEALSAGFARRFGRPAPVLVATAAAGATPIDV